MLELAVKKIPNTFETNVKNIKRDIQYTNIQRTYNIKKNQIVTLEMKKPTE